MKKRTLFLLGTLIIGMAFGLVLAGCATDSGVGPSAEELAAQLAEDINAYHLPWEEPGSRAGTAVVNGATVTLTRGLQIRETQLTVPKGVTLDVTADGVAYMLINATLTVNGTVNARAGGIRIEDTGIWGLINGNGTIYLKGKGSLLIVEGNKNLANRKLTLDGVTLIGVEDNGSALVGVGVGGEFVLKSGAITGNTRNGNGAGVEVYKSSYTNKNDTTVEGSGTFTMEGGEISGNTAKGEGGVLGGGVRVNEGAVFTMTGGTITGNTAKGVRNANGGGVFVEGSTFTMTGGTISDNSADSVDGDGGGGGVSVASATFNMSGGTISGNSTTSINGQGGGVRVFNPGATFTMEGGAIFGNASENGGGVHVRNRSTFTMKGGRIQGGTDSDGFTKNTDTNSDGSSALYVHNGATTAKWGTDGTYTKGGVSQTGDSDIVELNKHLSEADWDWAGNTDDTLIAIPAN
jgi:hypothetical protein